MSGRDHGIFGRLDGELEDIRKKKQMMNHKATSSLIGHHVENIEKRIKGEVRWFNILTWIKVIFAWSLYRVKFEDEYIDYYDQGMPAKKQRFRFKLRRFNYVMIVIIFSPLIIPLLGLVGFYLLLRWDADEISYRYYIRVDKDKNPSLLKAYKKL